MAEPGPTLCGHVGEGTTGIRSKQDSGSTYPALVSQVIVLDLIRLVWQHGRGTHIWILRQGAGSQSLMSNQYKGEFVQGQRHGPGTIYYACGATYEGEWSSNKSHGEVNQCYSFASHIQCTNVDSGSIKDNFLFLHAEDLPLLCIKIKFCPLVTCPTHVLLLIRDSVLWAGKIHGYRWTCL